MPHFYPIVIPGGRSLAGDSLGFHAYSLRIDNLTNQWLLEETSLAWIPPYSLGVCLRLYGTGVAIILNQAPIGQFQLAPITGEQSIGVYSDQLRTEVAGIPVREFTLIQAVSDLTEGPQPALPALGVCRIWADASGNLFHLHSDGTDPQIWDTRLPLGGVLVGTVPNPAFAVPMIVPGSIKSNNQQALPSSAGPGPEIYWDGAISQFVGRNDTTSTWTDTWIQGANIRLQAQGGSIAVAASTALTLTGSPVIPNLSTINASGSRINAVPVNANTTVVSTPLPVGNWMVWAQGMAMNTGASTDGYAWNLMGNPGGSTFQSSYMAMPSGGFWNTGVIVAFINNLGPNWTSIFLSMNNVATTCNIAGDFSRILGVRIA